MGIMDHQPTTDTPDLHMVTPLRPTGIGILITDHAPIPATGTVVTMGEEDILNEVVIMDIRGKENAL
jgi:ABC-type lipopolysaccharide export system ATPase subunit